LRLRHLVPLRPSLSFLSTIPRRQTTRSGEPMRQHAAEPMRLSGNLLAVPLFALPIVGRGSTASFFVQPGKIRIFVGIPEASPTERIDVVTSWRSRDAGQTAFKVFQGGCFGFQDFACPGRALSTVSGGDPKSYGDFTTPQRDPCVPCLCRCTRQEAGGDAVGDVGPMSGRISGSRPDRR
jgi:hypothetical protein